MFILKRDPHLLIHLDALMINNNEKNFAWDKYIERNFLLDPANGLVPDNKLTLHFEILYDDDIEEPEIISGQAQLEKYSQVRIVNDLSGLLKNGNLSDVVLVIGGKEFRGHKSILGARSSVFAQLFQSNENRYTITNVANEQVFEQFLKYIYSGRVQSLDQFAVQLFPVAHEVR